MSEPKESEKFKLVMNKISKLLYTTVKIPEGYGQRKKCGKSKIRSVGQTKFESIVLFL